MQEEMYIMYSIGNLLYYLYVSEKPLSSQISNTYSQLCSLQEIQEQKNRLSDTTEKLSAKFRR